VTNESEYNIEKSILRCLRDQEFPEIFFSVMDYRNNYFLSSDPKDIIHFYEGFENKEELIDWMKERPKGSYEIMEVEGKKDIIVVIPTADFEGEYAKRCREEIFKGLHIIFVVSGKGNNYFNYAHNCNVGINKAMDYNPNWIILSNDDMYKIDDINFLKNELENLDKRNIDIVLGDPPDIIKIGKPTIIRDIIYFLYNSNVRNRIRLEKYFIKKLKMKIYFTASGTFIDKLLYNNIYEFYSMGVVYGSMTILNFRIAKNYNEVLFDETYINGYEDIDFYLRLNMEKVSKGYTKFKVGAIGGASLGKNGSVRTMRDIANLIYFNCKFEKLWKRFK